MPPAAIRGARRTCISSSRRRASATLVTEVFADDDPYLDEDTVFGVRDDLVMSYKPQPAGSFPDGFELSGKVPGDYLRVDFDFKLARG